MTRLFVEKKTAFRAEAASILQDIRESFPVAELAGLRILQRYDIQWVEQDSLAAAKQIVFSDPAVDDVFEGTFPLAPNETSFAVEFLPGQFDQRADSAAQCAQILFHGERPKIATARVYVLLGNIPCDTLAKIKAYLINPVDSREASPEIPLSLTPNTPTPQPVPNLESFNTASPASIRTLLSLAMSEADIQFCQNYFTNTACRPPTLTEIRVLDTYWSDHCRHTTFRAKLETVTFDNPHENSFLQKAWQLYLDTRKKLGRLHEDVCLMDMATLAARALKASGKLDDLEESAEINAASIVVPVKIKTTDGTRDEEWVVMFKNETHNHPTEIEPFGGAATCLGGAIRDPLSGRSYVYQAMRVTGSGDPRAPFSETLPGKLPQRKITRAAAAGYSSYGNQIGLATGLVAEIYDTAFIAKRMEVGAVIAAAPRKNILRAEPVPGDVIVLVGGRTGRDGIGGATGSSKEHTETALQNSAEVQKGDPTAERKLQRLFRDPAISQIIKRCNDFGAGGVSVAIGELAPSLDIDLDAIPLKYNGLDGTEIAISESQERMAVVLDPADVEKFCAAAAVENVETAIVARVTDTGFLRMTWRNQRIVNLHRDFIDTNGAPQTAIAQVSSTPTDVVFNFGKNTDPSPKTITSFYDRWLHTVSRLNTCSQRGLGERFDASVGAGTVLHPFGGKHQITPIDAMAAKLPVLDGDTDTCTLMAFGFNPEIARRSPADGALTAIVESIARIVATGGDPSRIRLSFQEYFPKLGTDPARWGMPVAALLAAFHAQMQFNIPAIGGKDSMSGSFKTLDVPPTLVSFAVATTDANHVISPEFKTPGSSVWCLWSKSMLSKISNKLALQFPSFPSEYNPKDTIPFDELQELKALFSQLHNWIKKGIVLSARAIRHGGVCSAITEMCMGNSLGFKSDPAKISWGVDVETAYFTPLYGAIIIEVAEAFDNVVSHEATLSNDVKYWKIGHVTNEKIIEIDPNEIYFNDAQHCRLSGEWLAEKYKNQKIKIPLSKLRTTWETPLENTFPTKAPESKNTPLKEENFSINNPLPTPPARSRFSQPKPRVLIPVFPGTNCEYDTARAFHQAGAVPQILVIRNQTSSDVDASLRELASALHSAQILALPGGFSAGDEPDGSGKFIAALFRNNIVCDATLDLLKNRDGLILGICNGFQALLKLGLVPFGDIRDTVPDAPTLFRNSIGRHISRYAHTRLTAPPNRSPWLSQMNPNAIHTLPLSHGEGRFIASPALLAQMESAGQIAFRYCDETGTPASAIEHNPNGSSHAIEGIISPCGRVLGKMGHSERRGAHVAKNIPELSPNCKHQPLFESGVAYFS
ncbi:MAG: phosphoribosylformylglycinamidine synthase [Puniceicoccales bacterium]|jgi:phosphoribosylformylglycinamidine synthase|nr:phosphoribosylformylglycinamidine synthase [Puniceicoccales bacterium]